jgi:uncharacterized LabA/DUF88 family protein
MNRVLFFFDGFNLYHALHQHRAYHKYKWLDLSKLASCYVTQKDQIVEVLYFTAYVPWNPEKVNRHQTYVRALHTRQVKVIFGKFKPRDRRCPNCGKTYRTFEEKQTDVNIALQLFEAALQDRFDTAILVSGDSDLLPSIEAVKSSFPAKRVGVVIPIGRHAEELKHLCDFHIRMKEKHLRDSQFPDEIELGAGQRVVRPPSWR